MCHFLDFFPYDKNKALKVLQKEYDYKPYPYKHYESIFTRFYQGYILPQKFSVDKRKVHLSTLISANQMDRDEALEQIKNIPYPSKEKLNNDIDYFLKKWVGIEMILKNIYQGQRGSFLLWKRKVFSIFFSEFTIALNKIFVVFIIG